MKVTSPLSLTPPSSLSFALFFSLSSKPQFGILILTPFSSLWTTQQHIKQNRTSSIKINNTSAPWLTKSPSPNIHPKGHRICHQWTVSQSNKKSSFWRWYMAKHGWKDHCSIAILEVGFRRRKKKKKKIEKEEKLRSSSAGSEAEGEREEGSARKGGIREGKRLREGEKKSYAEREKKGLVRMLWERGGFWSG